MTNIESPAEIASKKALEAVLGCLDKGDSFRLEAGAGAGKTYSLVKALQFLIDRNQKDLLRNNQKIACITFTNVAKDEIEARTDRNPVLFCETNHTFCWSLINVFQKQLRELIPTIPAWQERLVEVGEIGNRSVEYNLGHRSIRDTYITLHHDDILPLTISLMENEKFRRLMTERFPIILIDEYQDTDANWVEAIKTHFLGQPDSPLFGFFGDHWQKIYNGGCGKLEHPAIHEIGKEANFRSVDTIVQCLNRMRPELPQFVVDPSAIGEVRIFHTNHWPGKRQNGAHWGGDLPPDIAHEVLESVKTKLVNGGWDISAEKTKILMLTHRVLAAEQGYASLPTTFRFNEAFIKKENSHIAYLVDVLEPACEAYSQHHYGKMFEAIGAGIPLIRGHNEKVLWSNSMDELLAIRDHGTVGQVIDHLRQSKRPRLPDAVEDREHELSIFNPDLGEEMPRYLEELRKLRLVSYSEIKALKNYLDGYSPFETKHGVKGAEFENVLVVIGRGWSLYNFGEMLETSITQPIPETKKVGYERNRNLFYVACSRPKKRLSILFTQELSGQAMETLKNWFGAQVIEAINF